MPTDNSELQFDHPAKKPFEDLLARAKKREAQQFPPFIFFMTLFLSLLSVRAVWELHRVGYPVSGLIVWAGLVAGGVTMAPLIRAAIKLRHAKN